MEQVQAIDPVQHPMLGYFAGVQPKRGVGRPSKRYIALTRALSGGQAEIAEYVRLFAEIKTKRRIGRPTSWSDEELRLWLILVDRQRATMSSGRDKATIKDAITNLVVFYARRGGMSDHNARKRVAYLQKIVSVARKRFR